MKHTAGVLYLFVRDQRGRQLAEPCRFKPYNCHFIIFPLSVFPSHLGMHILPPTLVLLSLLQHGFAGMLKAGEPCSVANNRLQEGTFQFWSECTSSNYCDEVENICKPKRCRRDDYPFGYEKGAHLPDKCKKGQFCPDEGTDCQDVLPVDSPCQLNRDGELHESLRLLYDLTWVNSQTNVLDPTTGKSWRTLLVVA